MELILKAREKEMERTAWELWLSLDGEGKEKNPFSKILNDLKKPIQKNTDTRTDEEVIQDAENILKSMKRSS